jgi:hypothetical protein
MPAAWVARPEPASTSTSSEGSARGTIRAITIAAPAAMVIATVEIIPVDPRDTERDEDFPAYRVDFWERLPVGVGVPAELASHRCDEHELRGAESVHEALAWAEANAGPNRTYVLYTRTVDGTLVRLAGRDPTAPANAGPVLE